MGLDTSHGCWTGAYSAFHRWRVELARAAGVNLSIMEGFYGHGVTSVNLEVLAMALDQSPLSFYAGGLREIHAQLPIKWDSLKPDVLYPLLYHSDCDGIIPSVECEPLANRLEELLPKLAGDGGGHVGSYREKTQTFINGLRLAASLGEDVDFH